MTSNISDSPNLEINLNQNQDQDNGDDEIQHEAYDEIQNEGVIQRIESIQILDLTTPIAERPPDEEEEVEPLTLRGNYLKRQLLRTVRNLVPRKFDNFFVFIKILLSNVFEAEILNRNTSGSIK